MLELREAEGAFKTLQAYLDGAEFSGAPGVVADLFLGYGLSRTCAAPTRPILQAVPAAAPRLPDPAGRRVPAGRSAFRIGGWERTRTGAEYARRSTRSARRSRGDVYQVNLVQHLSAPFRGDPRGLAGARAASAALPTAALRRRLDDRLGLARAPARATATGSGRSRSRARPLRTELAESEKDAAERIMIVDLGATISRGSASRAASTGRAPRGATLAGVSHLVSRVEAGCAPASLAEILAATFPGGSVTGAPRSRP